MRQAVYGIISCVIIILTIGIILTVNGKKTRRDDMENALAISVENAVETTMNEKTYSLKNSNEFIADFTQNLLLQISNDADIEVSIAKMDYENGLMSVRITEYFTHPNGKEGKNECETTVLFEKTSRDAEFVSITFMLDADTEYKEYQVAKGDNIIAPKSPTQDGGTFVGWMREGTNEIVTGFDIADESRTYIAVFQ